MPSVWKSCQLLCVFLSIKILGPTTNHCCGSKHWWDNTKYIVYICVYTQHKKHYRGKMIYWFGVFFFCNAQILGILCIYMKLKDSSNTTPQGCTLFSCFIDDKVEVSNRGKKIKEVKCSIYWTFVKSVNIMLSYSSDSKEIEAEQV